MLSILHCKPLKIEFEKEFYYKLNHKIRHHDENVLFKLSWKYDLNDGLLEKKVKGFGRKGFIMLYFSHFFEGDKMG